MVQKTALVMSLAVTVIMMMIAIPEVNFGLMETLHPQRERALRFPLFAFGWFLFFSLLFFFNRKKL